MFFHKLNEKFVIDYYNKKNKQIEYGMDSPIGFKGMQYWDVHTTNDEDLLQVIPRNYRDECKFSLMEVNHEIPAHSYGEGEVVIDFYIATDQCITQFYYPIQDNTESEGAVFYDGYLKKGRRFMAKPGDAYLLDTSKPYAIIPTKPGIVNRRCLSLHIPSKTFAEAVEMLKSTDYIDD